VLYTGSGEEFLGARPRIDTAPRPDDRFHTVKDGDRIDLIAFSYLGDAALWWIVCDYSDIFYPLELETGAVLRIDRIKEIHARLPNTHLVMHGSSSVPQDWLKIINENGGDMGATYGVPVEEIVEGIKNGVRKINIDTDLRMASTGAIRQFMNKDKKNFDPRKYLAEARKAMKAICKARYEAFGCAGQASKIKVIGLEAMANRYKKGELNAIVK
jgi:hypothetical protein